MNHPHAVVRKSNSLIEASYKLSVNEQRLILMLASSVKMEDKDFCPYQISIKDFVKLLDLKNKNIYQDVEALVLGLREKTLTIVQANSVLHTGWLSSIEYFKGDGILELSFDPKMKPFLLDLKERFTSYKLRMVIQLRSSFSIRLYELLKQYERLGERVFELSRLRVLLGIEEDQYKLYGHFKSRVLLPAQKELGEKTDISFTFKEQKEGRSVSRLKFVIQPQNPPSAKLLNLPENTEKIDQYSNIEALIEILPAPFREQESIKRVLFEYEKKFGREYVTRNILYTNEKSNAVKPGANISKGSNYRVYLSKALHGDFGLAYWEDLQGRKLQEEKSKKLETERSQREKGEMAQRNREREDIARAKVYLENLPPEALKDLRNEAIGRMDDNSKELLARQHPAGEMMLKIVLTKVALEKMKIS